MRSSNAATTALRRAPQLFSLRVLLMLAAAFAFGMFAAVVKDPDSDMLSTLAQLRSNLADLSAPWLMLAFIVGRQSSRFVFGALWGLMATMCALLGFYLLTLLVLDYGGTNILDNFWRAVWANRIYFAGGVLSGPLFGALGTRRQTTRVQNGWVIAGVLMVGEPIVMTLSGILFPGAFVGLATTRILVYAAEVALGLVVVLVAWSRGGQ